MVGQPIVIKVFQFGFFITSNKRKIAILYFFVDKQIIRNFFTHPIGIAAAVAVAILELCGFLTIRKIVNIDI